MAPVLAKEVQAFGRYALVAKLATGGMAEIFLARLEGAGGFEKLVCVKRMLPQFVKDKALVAMFLSEAKIAAHISHPNVCQVFELGEIEGRYFIAMEYLQGVPLTCFRRRDMYPRDPAPRLVAALGTQACEGLHHAHNLTKPDGTSLDVVHRDVSTSNLFATIDGVVKVLDFGIAKVQDASVRTTPGSVKGTYAYMAPEQLRGETVDRRTDVFAVGVVLWELLARRHLFRRETDFLTFQAITTDPIPDICTVRPDVPAALGAVIARALSRDRDQRPASARALADALREATASLGGPLSGPALSDEITSVFAQPLADQRKLIQVAREGGAFSLEDDLGPSVGHGAELTVTPVSVVSGGDHVVADPSKPRSVSSGWDVIEDPPKPRSTTSDGDHVVEDSPAPRAETMDGDDLLEDPPAPPPETSGDTSADTSGDDDAVEDQRALETEPIPKVLPLLDTRRVSLRMALIAALALVGCLVVVVVLASRGSTSESRPADAAVVAAVAPDARTRIVPIDAPEAVADAELADAAGVPVDAPVRKVIVQRPPPPLVDPCRPDPNGPVADACGLITLFSTPVGAIVYVDGVRQRGKTPLMLIALRAGKHAVRAMSPRSGALETISITIEPKKIAPARTFTWQPLN